MPEIRGSRRWIPLGNFNLQTSEVLKIGFILLCASFFKNINVNKFSFKLVFLIVTVIACLAIVFIEPDLGTTVLILFTFISFVFFANLQIKKFFLFGLLILLAFIPGYFSLKTYQKERIIGFLNPAHDIQGTTYNVFQSIVAIGSGGFAGKGFGLGTQSHLRFLPEYHTDFIFATFAEEWGFVFSVVLLILYNILLAGIIFCAKNSKTIFGKYLCLGVFSLLSIQIFINIGMNLGLLPVTGIPLPFLSYGGSSIITCFILIGLVNIS